MDSGVDFTMACVTFDTKLTTASVGVPVKIETNPVETPSITAGRSVFDFPVVPEPVLGCDPNCDPGCGPGCGSGCGLGCGLCCGLDCDPSYGPDYGAVGLLLIQTLYYQLFQK